MNVRQLVGDLSILAVILFIGYYFVGDRANEEVHSYICAKK